MTGNVRGKNMSNQEQCQEHMLLLTLHMSALSSLINLILLHIRSAQLVGQPER